MQLDIFLEKTIFFTVKLLCKWLIFKQSLLLYFLALFFLPNISSFPSSVCFAHSPVSSDYCFSKIVVRSFFFQESWSNSTFPSLFEAGPHIHSSVGYCHYDSGQHHLNQSCDCGVSVYTRMQCCFYYRACCQLGNCYGWVNMLICLNIC